MRTSCHPNVAHAPELRVDRSNDQPPRQQEACGELIRVDLSDPGSVFKPALANAAAQDSFSPRVCERQLIGILCVIEPMTQLMGEGEALGADDVIEQR